MTECHVCQAAGKEIEAIRIDRSTPGQVGRTVARPCHCASSGGPCQEWGRPQLTCDGLRTPSSALRSTSNRSPSMALPSLLAIGHRRFFWPRSPPIGFVGPASAKLTMPAVVGARPKPGAWLIRILSLHIGISIENWIQDREHLRTGEHGHWEFPRYGYCAVVDPRGRPARAEPGGSRGAEGCVNSALFSLIDTYSASHTVRLDAAALDRRRRGAEGGVGRCRSL